MKRTIIVHGYRGRHDLGWLAWIAGELEARGIEVVQPKLPREGTPNVAEWVSVLNKTIGKLDAETFIVAHSMGCPVTLRYLSEYPAEPDLKIAGMVLVAGFYAPADHKYSEFFGPEPDFDRLKSMVRQRTVILTDCREMARALDATAIELHNRDHFDNNVDQKLEEALDATLKSFE
jgi:predicted alpha/beta hydrolase family esterase